MAEKDPAGHGQQSASTDLFAPAHRNRHATHALQRLLSHSRSMSRAAIICSVPLGAWQVNALCCVTALPHRYCARANWSGGVRLAKTSFGAGLGMH